MLQSLFSAIEKRMLEENSKEDKESNEDKTLEDAEDIGTNFTLYRKCIQYFKITTFICIQLLK